MTEIKTGVSETCEDNRFKLVAKYRAKLFDGTNIEDRPEEMAVIDNVLFRCWQMGWLDQLEGSYNENEKLRGDVERMFNANVEKNDEIARLLDENTELRELAYLVAEYTSVDQCEGCVTKRACNAGDLDMCWIRKAILEKLRELGVEAE